VEAERLLTRLREICGDAHVVSDPHALSVYASDGLARYRETPLAAVLPATAEEVVEIVRSCHEAAVPFVARGAGTGLSGGALPHAEGVLIVLSRLRRILSVDLADAVVVAEPGVTNLAISAAVGPTHVYPPDPSSQLVCTIGGNVAENAGGAHCFKYGFTTNYVTGLDVVLADGTLVELRRDQPGYDLIGAFVGSEGTLGVAVRIHLRVVPAPETTRTVVAFFDDAPAAAEAASAIVASAIVPAAIELMDSLAISAAERAVAGGYRTDAGGALLVELDGPLLECAAALEHLLEICLRSGARDVRVATDAAEREALWRTRRAAFPAMTQLAPACYLQDGVVPRTRLAEVLREIERLSAEYGLAVANVFHAGDGNLHPLICYDPGIEGEEARAEQLAVVILDECLKHGGSITGEHGVGVDKSAFMPRMFSAADLDAFHRLRCSFDPGGLANPGKVMPTPRLCGERPGRYQEHPLEQAGLASRF
jgi:glycolate oxidase